MKSYLLKQMWKILIVTFLVMVVIVGFGSKGEVINAQISSFSPKPLHLYWHAGREDNFTTATTEGKKDAEATGYQIARIEGYIFTGQITDTVPLKLYWHADREDNLTIATPEGEVDALNAGYQFARVEGYIFTNQITGTVPLKLYWHAGRQDYFTTATAEGEADALNAGYEFVRIEGYVLPPLTPLHLYWSEQRTDNFTTATLKGRTDSEAAGYEFARLEGYVVAGQRTDTVPLKLYWHADREDNFVTATPEGEVDAINAGYQLARIGGYIFTSQVAGTVPLKLYWHADRQDFFTTATAEGAADAVDAGYQFVRIEGYVFPPFEYLRLYWNEQRGDNFSTATLEGMASAGAADYQFVRSEGNVFEEEELGTIPLKLYWHEDREDNFVIATVAGEADAVDAGYQYARIEGYIFATNEPGTVPLKLYWNADRQDYFTTTTVEGESAARFAGYEFVRIEGYVFPWAPYSMPTPPTTPPPPPPGNCLPFFSQKDGNWAHHSLRSCNTTIGAMGCTLSSAAMVFWYYGATTTRLGDTMNPANLNVCMGQDACPFDWLPGKTCAQDKVNYGNKTPFSFANLETKVREGPVILKLTKGATGQHWVVVYSGSGGGASNYLINDPWMLRGGTKLSTLTDYGWQPQEMAIYRGTPLCATSATTVPTPNRAVTDVPQSKDSDGQLNITRRGIDIVNDLDTSIISGKVWVYHMTELTMTLQLTASSSITDVIEMRVWSDTITDTAWQPFSPYVWMPMSDVTYAQYRTRLGDITEVYSDTVNPIFGPPDLIEPEGVYLPIIIK